MDFGMTIASFRKKWGMDQQELADAIGMSKSYVSIVESGHRKPSMKMLTKIADYFDVPLSYLMLEASKNVNPQKVRKDQATMDVIDPIIQELAHFLMSQSKTKGIREDAKKKKVSRKG